MSGVEEPVVVEQEPTVEYAVVHSLQQEVESKTHEEDETILFKMLVWIHIQMRHV